MTIHLPPDGRLRSITIREPFATAIALGAKCIENRSLPYPKSLPLPMTVAIHASNDEQTIVDDITDLANGVPWLHDVFDDHPGENRLDACVIGKDYFYCQTIVGLVDIVACVRIDDLIDGTDITDEAELERRLAEHGEPDDTMPDNKWSQWANGPYCYLLRNARRFKQGIMTRGQLGLWRVPEDVQAMIIDHSQDLIRNPRVLPKSPCNGVAKCVGKRLVKT